MANTGRKRSEDSLFPTVEAAEKPKKEGAKKTSAPNADPVAGEAKPQPARKRPQPTAKARPAKQIKNEEPQSQQPSVAPVYTPGEHDPSTDKPEKQPRFENLIANEEVLEALRPLVGETPSPLLSATLPIVMRGSSAFLLAPASPDSVVPAIAAVASRLLDESLPRGRSKSPAALFLTLTDGSAVSLYESCRRVFDKLSLSVALLDENSVPTEAVDVFVATLNGVLHAKKHNALELGEVGFFLFHDMHRLAHETVLQSFKSLLPKIHHQNNQKVFLSCENRPEVREIAFQLLDDPESLNLLPAWISPRVPKQFAHALQATQKFQVLLGHLKTHKPACAVVYTNTKTVADWLAFKLHGNDIAVEVLTSSPSAHKRQELLKSLQKGEKNVLVVTDMAAKNLGITQLACLYNFDIPEFPETFIERLSKIEGARHPLAVSFICEDYGFYMAGIEKVLGFKIHVAQPDKNYFHLKDTSEYPLESDGRVKRILPSGSLVTEPAKQTIDSVLRESPYPTSSTTLSWSEKPAAKIQPRAGVTEHKLYEIRPEGEKRPAAAASSRTSESPRFERRDERARDIVDSARVAAKAMEEKRRQSESTPPPSSFSTHKTEQQQPLKTKQTQRYGFFALAASLVQDVVQAATAAAKESLAQNLEQKMPKLSGFLEQYSPFKKQKPKKK